jgi:hypothetical protein
MLSSLRLDYAPFGRIEEKTNPLDLSLISW